MRFSVTMLPKYPVISRGDSALPRRKLLRFLGCGRKDCGYDPWTSPFNQAGSMPMEAPEAIEVERQRVACDGGGGGLGHPRVCLEMGDETFVECPYCDRRFVLRDGAGHTDH